MKMETIQNLVSIKFLNIKKSLEVRNNGDIRLVTTGDVPVNNGLAINVILPIL